MFIGFYNGLIAPYEFDTHRRDQMSKAVNDIMDSFSEWAKKRNNIWWLIGGSVLFAILVIKYNKYTIPLIFLLIAMTPMFVNDQHGQPKYFAQLTKGQVIIEIP